MPTIRSSKPFNITANLPYSSDMSYPIGATALVLIDPYNDFASPGGKMHGQLLPSIESHDTLTHLSKLVSTLHSSAFADNSSINTNTKSKIRIFYAGHRRFRAGDYADYQFATATQQLAAATKAFEFGSWGGEFKDGLEPDLNRGDVVATEHFTTSGFANTNLDFLLRKHGITHIVLAGFVANSCVESTLRYGVELGYHTTVLSDAVAAFNPEGDMAASVNYKAVAHAVLTTEEWLKAVV